MLWQQARPANINSTQHEREQHSRAGCLRCNVSTASQRVCIHDEHTAAAGLKFYLRRYQRVLTFLKGRGQEQA